MVWHAAITPKRGGLMKDQEVPMTSFTRRKFIKSAVAATGAAGFAIGCRHIRGTEGMEVSRDAVDRLGVKVRGRLIVPDDPSYESARRVFYWNATTERRPLAIVQCAHEDDARRAVEFARRHELEVAARAGGHSHLGWGCSNGVVIDLSGMKQVAIDPSRRTARCEGGVLSGEVARRRGAMGLRLCSGNVREWALPASSLGVDWAGCRDCTARRATICSRPGL
jgi:hypothetical protein